MLGPHRAGKTRRLLQYTIRLTTDHVTFPTISRHAERYLWIGRRCFRSLALAPLLSQPDDNFSRELSLISAYRELAIGGLVSCSILLFQVELRTHRVTHQSKGSRAMLIFPLDSLRHLQWHYFGRRFHLAPAANTQCLMLRVR